MRLSDKAKSVLKAVAPTLATALGGPLMGAATSAILGKLGGDEAKVEDLISAADPATLLALKQADNEFKAKMKELDIKEEDIHMKDRDSARQRQVNMRDWTPTALALVVLVAWGFAQHHLLTEIIPEGNRELVAAALRTLDMLLGMAFMYFFGSSKGSKDKTDLLQEKK